MNDISDTIERRKLRDALLGALEFTAYMIVLALVAFCYGCAAVLEGGMPAGAYDFVTNSVQRAVAAAERAAEEYSRRDDGAGQTEDPATTSTGEEVAGAGNAPGGGGGSASTQPSAGSTFSAPVLVFKYGGFKGDRAAEDSRCRISKLKVGSDSLSLRWDTKIPGDWARKSDEKGDLVIVAAFYLDSSGRWIGGKFDWIDESRTSRSLKNINGGYGGWDGAAFLAARSRAVCIVSADGKFRSNLLEESR